MKVVLANPFYRPVDYGLGLPAVEMAFGAIPPINLLYVAQAFRAHGADVRILDAEAGRLPDDQLVEQVIATKPDVVGFTATTFSYHQTLALAKKIKERTSAVLCQGGRHTAYYPKEILRNSSFDYLLMGEIEPAANDFIAFLKGNKKAADVPGLVYREGDTVIANEKAPDVQNLDELPFPARDLIDNAAYFSLMSKWRNFTLLLSSRGCPCRCKFCAVGRTVWRARSAENVVAEMEECHSRFGINEFDICDPDFCFDRERVLKIAEGVGGRYHFSGRARVNDLSEEVIEKLAAGGCFRLHLGIESADVDVLAELEKSTELERIPRIVKAARRSGMAIVAYFMLGNPRETDPQARRTIKMASDYPFTFVQFTRTLVLPR